MALSQESRASLLCSRSLRLNFIHDILACGRFWIGRPLHVIMNWIQEIFQICIQRFSIFRNPLQNEVNVFGLLCIHNHRRWNISTQRNKCALLLLLLSQFVSRTENIFQQIVLWDLKFILAFIQVSSIVCAAGVHLLFAWIWKRKCVILRDSDFWNWPDELAILIFQRCVVIMSFHWFCLYVDFALFLRICTSAVILLQNLLVLSFRLYIESISDFAC